jgi:hypothetical protein
MEQHLELSPAVIASDLTLEARQQSFEMTTLWLLLQTGALI